MKFGWNRTMLRMIITDFSNALRDDSSLLIEFFLFHYDEI